jgi:hypothetical protein
MEIIIRKNGDFFRTAADKCSFFQIIRILTILFNDAAQTVCNKTHKFDTDILSFLKRH